jgi:hypothetical protein
MPTTYYRRDEEVQDFMGNPVMGVQIAVASQPANTSVFPPTPSVNLYADSVGTPLTTAPQTNQDGHASYYAQPGLYTVCYFSTQIAAPGQQIILTDQAITGPTNLPQFNSDTTINGTIRPGCDGVTVAFTLSAAPNPPASLKLMLNGLLVSAYAFAGSTVVLQSPPPAGSVLSATYHI